MSGAVMAKKEAGDYVETTTTHPTQHPTPLAFTPDRLDLLTLDPFPLCPLPDLNFPILSRTHQRSHLPFYHINRRSRVRVGKGDRRESERGDRGGVVVCEPDPVEGCRDRRFCDGFLGCYVGHLGVDVMSLWG
jgi:hypothetical protein